MHRRQLLASDSQTAELVQPCDRALLHPADLAQIAPMRRAKFGNLMRNAPPLQGLPMRLAVVPPISLHALGLMQRPPALAPGSSPFQQWHKLHDIVAIY